MAPKSKQKIHCQNIAKLPKKQSKTCNEPVQKVNTDMMVISALLNGQGYEGTKHQANRYNCLTPCKRTFYQRQKKIVEKVTDMVSDECHKYAKQIKPNSTVSCDCSWNHKVCGSAGTVTLFDLNQKKVVDFQTLTKSKSSFVGNYDGKSNNMETEGLQRIFNKIGDDLKNKEVEFVHDDDNKTHRLLEKNNHIKIKETIDPGHGIQQLKRKANTFFENASREMAKKKQPGRKTIKACFELFSTLISKIIIWFKFIVFNVDDKEKKEQMWTNTTDHVLGVHDNCTHPSDLKKYRGRGRPRKPRKEGNEFWEWEEGKNDLSLKNLLIDFLKKTVKLVRKTGKKRTQDNESLNASMRIYAPKNKVFSVSNEARVAIAVGKKTIHYSKLI